MMNTGTSTRHVYHQGFPLRPDLQISRFHRLIRGRLGVTLFIALTVVLCTLPIIFISWPVFILLVKGTTAIKRSCSRFVKWSFGVWLYMESYFLDKIMGTRTRIFGHSKPFSDRCLIVLNHRCHFDWMFFFTVICKQGDPRLWLAVLKYSGKHFPILGWAMQLRNFFFLTRKWSIDEKELNTKLEFLKTTNSKYQILLFPEGTDLNPSSYKKSCTYAEENGLPSYEYCLYPKTTGFKFMLQTLRQKYQIDTVYDVTVGYPDHFAPTEKELVLEGRVPREIHYHIRRYEASSIPETDKGIEKWIEERWNEKEERLKLFYKHRKFCELPFDDATRQHGNGFNDHKNLSLAVEVERELLLSNVVHAILFCIVNLVWLVYLCWMYWYIAVLAVGLGVGMIYVSAYTRGADYMILERRFTHEKMD